MHEIGLYHPRIHFPSDAWIKTAALYWTKMARIVPAGYVPHDSETVRMLRDELDFVLDVDTRETRWSTPSEPEAIIRGGWEGACEEFLHFITHSHAELREKYGIEGSKYAWTDGQAADFAFGSEPWADPQGEPLVAEVADEKIAWALRRVLVERGLASAKPHRQGVRPEPLSLLMHPNLARVYMSALAEDIARDNHLRPTTDDNDMYAVGTGWTEARMRNLLLPADDPRTHSGHQAQSARYAHRWPAAPDDLIGMIAIQAVIPRDIERIPVKKIIEIKKALNPYFVAFRDKVDSVATGISQQLEGVQNAGVALAYLEQEVHEQLLVPAKELRNEMHRMKIDTATATLAFKYEVPAIASLVAGGALAHEPLLAGSAAAAIGLLGLVRGARREAATRQATSPVSYLMLLEHNLSASSVLERSTRRIRKITGLT